MTSINSSIAQFFPDGKEPVFAAPWEAHAFALTVKLHEHGLFSWTEWSQQLANTIQSNSDTPYYENWLKALETLLAEKGIVESREILQGIEALKSDPSPN